MTGRAEAPRRVLVDTNVVVDVLRGLPAARAVLATHLRDGDALLLSVLTRYELLAGARPAEMASLHDHLSLYVHVPVDEAVADRAGALARTYRRSHAAIDAIDYLVAATVQIHADELLTVNVKHFPMITGLAAAYRR